MKLEEIFCQTLELSSVPKDFENLRMGDIVEWDSIGNMNILLSIEEHYDIRFSINEMQEINSIKLIREKVDNQ